MSQPLLRLVGRRQEFQQTSIAVKRLGDIRDIPQESHTLAFRDGDHLPRLNKNLDLAFQPGRLTVLMGRSGCGEANNWGLSPIMLPIMLSGFQPRPADGGALRQNHQHPQGQGDDALHYASGAERAEGG